MFEFTDQLIDGIAYLGPCFWAGVGFGLVVGVSGGLLAAALHRNG